jgi:hypothetical protein
MKASARPRSRICMGMNHRHNDPDIGDLCTLSAADIRSFDSGPSCSRFTGMSHSRGAFAPGVGGVGGVGVAQRL